MHPYIIPVANELTQLADANKAIIMKAYMKNQFEFLGINTPERRSVCKQYMKQYAIEDASELEVIVKELWSMPQREYQYFAMELLSYNKKLWQLPVIKLIEFCITNKSWWDTVDFLAYDCAGKYFTLYPQKIKQITGRWNNSGNMWLQRASLLYHKSYKRNTDTSLLSQYILKLATSREFFIQKAIGWILREYAKTNAGWVSIFVNEHTLAPLSKREAMKHL